MRPSTGRIAGQETSNVERNPACWSPSKMWLQAFWQAHLGRRSLLIARIDFSQKWDRVSGRLPGVGRSILLLPECYSRVVRAREARQAACACRKPLTISELSQIALRGAPTGRGPWALGIRPINPGRFLQIAECRPIRTTVLTGNSFQVGTTGRPMSMRHVSQLDAFRIAGGRSVGNRWSLGHGRTIDAAPTSTVYR